MKDPLLWSRLRDFDFPLSKDGLKLLRKVEMATALKGKKAQEAVEAYRRFIYLVATSDEALAPSRAVDAVWHLHLEDTRAYLGEFSQTVVGRVIHHNPGRPKPAHDPAYLRTLQRYGDEWGEGPSFRIWPEPPRLRRLAILKVVAVCGLWLIFFWLWAGGIDRWATTLPAVGLIVAGLIVHKSILHNFGAWPVYQSRDDGGSGCGGSTDSGGDGCGGD